MFDTNNNGSPDLLYFVDDRTGTNGGIYKWVSADNGATWTAGTPARIALGTGSAQGGRGLAGHFDGTSVTLLATTTATSANTVVKVVDDLSGNDPAVSELHKAAANTVLRGVALGPR
jgi:hypothetical protein